MPPVLRSAEILKFVFTAAEALGVMLKVAVDSCALVIGPIACAGSTGQPEGTVSATVPAGRARSEPDRTWTVAWNVSPATLKKREKVRYSRVPSGSPPGSGMVAPSKIALSWPAAAFAVPSGLIFG